MKNLLFLLILSGLLSCNSEDGYTPETCYANGLSGNYEQVGLEANKILIRGNCELEGTYCDHEMFLDTRDYLDNGSIIVSVTGYNGDSNCLSYGNYSCNATNNGTEVSIDCGGPNQFTFRRY